MYSAKEIFAKYHRNTLRELGQHFIFNENINKKIVAAAGDVEGKVIAEVGPGPGGITLELLKLPLQKLYLVEYDRHWAAVWRELRPDFGNKLEIIEADALNFDLHSIAPQIVLSNLPYNISTQLLFRWLPRFHLCEKFILMFQKEVADRLYAVPRSKAYGKLSVLVQWKSAVKKIFDLEPSSFSPPPLVRSSLLRLVPHQLDKVEHHESYDGFSHMMADVFAHRRKTVIKPLKKYFANPTEALSLLGYDPSTRAEQIKVEDFVKIYKMYVQMLTAD
ncbi:MAG: 16S rRNA (adenine(1518)-N(6)/adenine(1519)-N(6))-dimethyltransferase RsmA [Holosporaceae bacterium]|jgi:16S rRNA (adenine1518-N6/adenine1519-N6)-dimethyltransferase|nr:16S rRNA (adenine(1518)-N(6)/adenine(1519)-N(6))-dimethyltransferase RsmA [Holosporaceae bacterium]